MRKVLSLTPEENKLSNVDSELTRLLQVLKRTRHTDNDYSVKAMILLLKYTMQLNSQRQMKM